MIVYYDTSALIKRYVEEENTDRVDHLWQASDNRATSVVSFAETAAAFSRRLREGTVPSQKYREIMGALKEDLETFTLVYIARVLNNIIEALVSRHSLRGFDAIHLASAVRLKGSTSVPIQFACFDHSLTEAARVEGLSIPLDNELL